MVLLLWTRGASKGICLYYFIIVKRTVYGELAWHLQILTFAVWLFEDSWSPLRSYVYFCSGSDLNCACGTVVQKDASWLMSEWVSCLSGIPRTARLCSLVRLGEAFFVSIGILWEKLYSMYYYQSEGLVKVPVYFPQEYQNSKTSTFSS